MFFKSKKVTIEGMFPNQSPQPPQYHILIVDNEVKICDLLSSALKGKYSVDTACSGEEAFQKIDSIVYDLVVTDLKLGDKSGIDVLRRAKAKDDHTEAIIITGYASLDTAINAVNFGASSYLVKPVSLVNFIAQVDRSMASREFYIRSAAFIKQTSSIEPEMQRHLLNITDIYEFSRKLLTSLEIPEIMKCFLEELNKKVNPVFSAVGVSLFGTSEIYAMPRVGRVPAEQIRDSLLQNWDKAFGLLNKNNLLQNNISFVLFDGPSGEPQPLTVSSVSTVPMIIAGQIIGSIAVLGDKIELQTEEFQFLHILSSIFTPLVEHSYVHKRTKLMAETDGLTGLINHRTFQQVLSREIARANRNRTQFSLLMIDIDDFKKINDTYGHLIGDAVLTDMTKRLQASVRQQDIVARYGGEEFTVILPETDIHGANILAERVRSAIASEPYSFSESEIPYTISIGLCVYDGNLPKEKHLLIENADKALYISKNEGKNRITIK